MRRWWIYIAVAVLLIVVTYFLTKNSEHTVPDPGDDVDNDNLTYKDNLAKYVAIARAIFEALGTGSMFDDEDTVFRNLRLLKTADDWKYLQSIYQDATKDELDLVSRLIHNLDSDEIATVNSILGKFGESI